MKKACTINLGGIVFMFDEDAYELLRSYLGHIQSHLGNKEGSSEIIADIESRMAELFHQKKGISKQVITIEDVNECIKIMGNPEEITGEDPINPNSQAENSVKPKRRLYRDIENKVIGGVCSGLAAYFNVDPVLIRVLFAASLFIGGFGVPIYIVLWIALPAAHTAAQRLEMRGESINVSNLERIVREEFENTKKGTNWKNESGNDKGFFYRLIHIVGSIISFIIKAIAIFIGFIFIIVGLALLFALFFAVFGHSFSFQPEMQSISVLQFLSGIANVNAYWPLIISSSLVLLIPVLFIIYLGIKYLFRIKKDRRVLILASIIWALSIICTGLLIAKEFKGLAETGQSESEEFLAIDKPNCLYLNVTDKNINWHHVKSIFPSGTNKWYFDNDKSIFISKPTWAIIRNQGSGVKLELIKIARGINNNNAIEEAEKIIYSFQLKDSVFTADPFFSIPTDEKWHMQELEVKIRIPDGMHVAISQEAALLLEDTENTENLWAHDMGNKTWVMTPNGLSLDISK